MLPKKNLVASEKRDKKQNKELIKSQQ